MYFLSAVAMHPGVTSGMSPIATWAVSSPMGGEIIAVGTVAEAVTTLVAGVGPSRFGFTEDADGYSESRTCVQEAASP